jgi:hypothetical protein
MYQALLCLSMLAPGAEPCPCPGSSVCVREPVVTKVPHTTYTFKCTEFCLGHNSILRSLLADKNSDCDCRVHRKRDLVKKVCIEEKCQEKCVLHAAPPCEAGKPITPAPASSLPARP